jgi:hypothetical protein
MQELDANLVCPICNKKVEWGKCQACSEKKTPSGDTIWLCNAACLSIYNKEHKRWNPEKWAAIQEWQKHYEQQIIQPLTGKLKELWDSASQPDEVVHICIRNNAGALIATDSRVVIIEGGFQGFFAGPRCDSLPYNTIRAIDLSKGWLDGKIRFINADSSTTDTVFAGQFSIDLHFFKRDYAILKIGKEKIDKLRAEHQNKAIPTSPDPSIPSPSIIEQIKQLAELKDMGVITPDEFETKKAELLKRL